MFELKININVANKEQIEEELLNIIKTIKDGEYNYLNEKGFIPNKWNNIKSNVSEGKFKITEIE